MLSIPKDLETFVREIPEHVTHISIYLIGDGAVMSIFTNLGNIGNLNYQGMQIADSINGTVGELLKNKETEDVAAALRELTKAIAAEASLSHTNREELLQKVDFLGSQAAAPVAQRKKGLIKPIIDSVAGVCAGIGGLAPAWATWGPVLSNFSAFEPRMLFG